MTRLKVGSKVSRLPDAMDDGWKNTCSNHHELADGIFTVSFVSSTGNFIGIVELPDDNDSCPFAAKNFHLEKEKETLNNVELETYYKRKPEYQDDASWKLLCKEYNFKTDDCFKLGKVINKNVMTLKEFGKSLIFEMSYFDNVASPNQHKHLDLIRIFAKKAETSNTPWEGFQYKTLSGQWVDCVNAPVFNEKNEYRYCPEEVIKFGDKFTLIEFDHTKPTFLEVDSNFIIDGVVKVTFEALGSHHKAHILKADLLKHYKKVSN